MSAFLPPYLPTHSTAASRPRFVCSATATSKRSVLSHASLRKVESILNHNFRDVSLLAQALTHRSVANSKLSGRAFFEDHAGELVEVQNNERLECLGDKVFGLLATQTLFEHESQLSEGAISDVANELCSGKSAGIYLRQLGLAEFVLQDDKLKGKHGSRHGDCFEAILGALFLDGGYDSVRGFFRTKVEPMWNSLDSSRRYICQKRLLQEFLVSSGLPSPKVPTQISYIPVSFDPETKLFTQGIALFGRRVAIGTGPTRVSADQTAAKSLLHRLQGVNATCFLIRLARNANDEESLAKLRLVRKAQTELQQQQQQQTPISTATTIA